MTNLRRLAKHEALNTDLKYFCAHAPLLIKNKITSQVEIYRFNFAQEFVHKQLEKQRREMGRVRALILKGRQQGMSTYVAARFIHKAARKRNKKVFILAHEAPATKALFEKAKEYHQNMREETAPNLDESNARTLKFTNVGSEYQVGTAGAGSTGRGTTIDYFHGSEVAFWKNTAEIRTGVMQAVPPAPETEIILESTANGIGGMFHQMCMEAMEGKGEYILVFVPWFWQDEYRATPPMDFRPDEEERAYREQYGLDIAQLYWRRLKVIELGGLSMFRQEYPANPIEAFQATGEGLISPESILTARKSTIKDATAPLVMGVDPARTKDRIGIAFRRGRECPAYYVYDCKKIQVTDTWLASVVAQMIDKHKVVKCFIDCGAGYGVHDILVSRGYQKIVEPILFGQQAIERDVYHNKRVEMWDLMAQWLERGGVRIPDKDELHADLSMMPAKVQIGDGKYKLVSKDRLREEYGRSPDIGDALALTFAAPVNLQNISTAPQKATTINHKTSHLKTMRGR